MGDEKDKHQAHTKSSGWVGVVTGKTAKIVAALTVVAGLLSQIEQIVDGVKKLTTSIGGSSTDCLTAEMHVKPVVVRIQDWKTVQFQLTGNNRCRQKLQVHVAYKTQSDSIRIEPTIDRGPDLPACSGYDKSDCWETKSLDGGAINWVLMRPKLRKLSALADPAEIVINWIVFNTETGKQVRAGTAAVTVKDS